MRSGRWSRVAGLVILVGAGSTVWAQREPRIGYVYPAGGRQGSTFRVTIGGQYLDGATNLLLSGEGIRARVLEHVKPLTQKEINQLRERLEELTRQNVPSTRQSTDPNPSTPADRSTPNLPPMTRADRVRAIADLRAKLQEARRPRNPALGETVRVEVTLGADAALGETFF